MEAGETEVRTVLTRLQESGAAALPEDWAGSLTAASEDGRVAAWTELLATSAAATLGEAETALTVAEQEESDARAVLTEARARGALFRRGLDARSVLRSHDDSIKPLRHTVGIFSSDLRFAIGPEVGNDSFLTALRQLVAYLVRKGDR